MKIDSYGRVLFESEDVFDALYRDMSLTDLVAVGDEIIRYNELCMFNDKREYLINLPPELSESPEEVHERRQASWSIPEKYQTLDVWEMLLNKCTTDEQRLRLAIEQHEYDSRNLLPVLRLMIYLVDHFRERNVVWGVGRGSSVASFVLYLIGIIKINPMDYGLEIDEFLRY